MRHRFLILSIAALVAPAEAATAQTLSPGVKLAAAALPLATVSFTPYAAFGSLAGAPINLSLVAINLGPTARLDGAIMFKVYEKSVAYLNAPVALPNGTYSVQLVFSRVNSPAVVTITRNVSTLLVSCPLITSFNTTQSCNSGTFAITDGKLDLALGVPSGDEVSLSQVTVSRWK